MAAATEPSEDYLVHYFGLAYYKWIFVSSVGGFLALFLVPFQPFGVSNCDPQFSIDRAFLLSMLAIGLVLGVVGVVLSIATFPIPPINTGLPDVGPFVVSWNAILFVLMIRAQRKTG